MKKRITAVVLAALTAISVHTAFADVENVRNSLTIGMAFPGAEGGGMSALGARRALQSGNDIEVYHVTNLNDSGEGSFRDAVSKGNRIVVFDVSGMIDLESRVSIVHNNITIMGHTAPGDGICFRGNSVKINGQNIIMRYLRFRPGAKLADGSDTITQDGFSIPIGAKDIILDHCSISWGTDENLSIIGGENITVQRCIVSEALNTSIHDKGEHSYAGIWGGVNVSMHHNIIASHKSRNPKIGTSETVSMTPGYTDSDTVVDMWNNIIYNWGDKAGYGAENGANVNLVNNYYKYGPATPANKRARIFELSPGNKYQQKWSGDIYANGNYVDDDSEEAAAVNSENWQIDRGAGVYLGMKGISYNKLDELRNTSYLYNKTVVSAQEAYSDVISDVGATLPKQDLVDARIIDNVIHRTAPEHGSGGSVYLVDDPVDGIPKGQESLYDWRGYPIWESETRATDFDTDGDGIPDVWEDKMGLDKTNPYDSLNLGPDSYTWLEIYGEDLISPYTDRDNAVVKNDGKLSVNTSGAAKVEFYSNNIYLGEASEQELTGVENGNTIIVAGYQNGVLQEAKQSVYGADFEIPEVSGDQKRVFVWDSMEGMKPIEGAGLFSSIEAEREEGMNIISAKLTYDDNSVRVVPVTLEVAEYEEKESQAVSGDFEIVGTLKDIPNLVKNCYTGIYTDDFVVAAGYNDSFKPVIKYGKKSNAELSEKEDKGYEYIKISVSNGHADLYAAKNLVQWDKLSENGYDYKGTDPTAGTYIINPEEKPYTAFVPWKVVTEKTTPVITIDNIAENSRIGFNENIRVTIQAQSGSTVTDATVLFNGEIISEVTGLNVNENGETIDIPLSFINAQQGEITVMCFDSNYRSASDTVNVFISADPKPWRLCDIGASKEDIKTYVSVTADYTYKIAGLDGNIGGTSDKCGYLYQKFSGDSRIYYRSRMQAGKQFGIMLRKSLDADSECYFFGGEQSEGSVSYSLKSRTAKGADTSSDTAEGLSGQSLCVIAEKSGNTLNIYQTENSPTVYQTKKLLNSIDVSLLGEEYYLGFASVGGEGNPPDTGWIGIDNSSLDEQGNNVYRWNFEYGLDWCWQSQEMNVLKPLWANDEIGENAGGKLLLAPGDEYTGDRYVFREYLMNDEYVPEMSANILLTGEEPAMNVYLQTGDANTAYKITFDNDNKIKDANGNEIGNWEKDTFYNIVMRVGVDADTMDLSCKLTVDGVVSDIAIPKDGHFRTQINTEKKTPVTKAVYFEPLSRAEGKYYIDDISVIPRQDEYKIVSEKKMYTFENAEGYEGMTISGASAEILTKAKKVAGINFMGKVRLSGSATSVEFPVSGECEIRVYAVSANKEEVRSLVLNDGNDHILPFNTNGWADVEGSAAVHKYNGGAGTINIRANKGVDVYGIEVFSKWLETVN